MNPEESYRKACYEVYRLRPARRHVNMIEAKNEHGINGKEWWKTEVAPSLKVFMGSAQFKQLVDDMKEMME